MGRKKLDKMDKKKQYGYMLLPKHGNAIKKFAHTHGMTPSQLIDLFGSVLADKGDKVEKLLKLKPTCDYDNEDVLRDRLLHRSGIHSNSDMLNKQYKYHPKNKEELISLVDDPNVYLDDIDTSLITNMDFLFAFTKRTDFSGIETWDVSHVTTMAYMFNKCTSFNQPLNTWNVSKVENMQGMFEGCEQFNQPLDCWDVSNVKFMENMFALCRSFKQDLNSWKINKICTTFNMFYDCIKMKFKQIKKFGLNKNQLMYLNQMNPKRFVKSKS